MPEANLPIDPGPAIVLAPHPDDESIGCGGLIALMRKQGTPVSVLLLSDGTMSHAHSRRWPRQARAALRLSEFHAALGELGADPACSHAFGWADGALPDSAASGFEAAVDALVDCFESRAPATLILPWRRDPHPDHRAASALGRAANALVAKPARVLEYQVWMRERGSAADRPRHAEVERWDIDIASVVTQKVRAVAAHRSQMGKVIDDDPTGFILSNAMLARCAETHETYYEVRAE